MWVYPVYVLDLCLMVFLSYFLGNLVDMLDKKTKISGAFIGGVLLAAVTSLPELFTSFSSVVLVDEPAYVVGDILGSVVFDLVVLALETFIFVKNFRNSKIEKIHLINGLCCLSMYALAAYAFFAPTAYQVMLGDINLMSILILVIYIVTIVIQPKSSEEENEEKEEIPWSVKKIVTLFIISSILLIGSSIALTYLTKGIQERHPSLSGSVAGALLLGIGTSIPEIIATAQLFHKKNYDAGFGNIIGSCTFDFAILALTDFFSWHQWNRAINPETGEYIISERGIFIVDESSLNFEIFGACICLIFIGFVAFKIFSKISNNKKVIYSLTGVWACLSLVLYALIYVI